MPWEWFLTISEIKNVLPLIGFGESPKNFFLKFWIFKMFYRSQFSIFFDGTGLNQEKKMILHIRINRNPRIFAQRGFPGPRISKMSAFFGRKSEKYRKRSKSPQIDLYVCAKSIYLSFKPGFIKKYWELRPVEHFEQTGFRKKYFFRVSGIPPKRKRLENFDFQKLLGIILMVILSPHMGNLGQKWRHSVVYTSKMRKSKSAWTSPP